MHPSGSSNQSDQVVCPQCQGGNPSIARLCMWCGAPLKASAPNVQPPPAQPRQYTPPPVRSAPPQPYKRTSNVAPAARKVPIWAIIAAPIVLLLMCGLIVSLTRPGTSSNRSGSPSGGQDTSASSNSGNSSLTNTPSQPQFTSTPIPTLDPAQAVIATQTAGAASAGNIPQGSGYLFANETSHTISNFYDAFIQFGDVASLGFPITEPFIEQNQTDGTWHWVQYYEKAVIEYHPELDPANRYQLATLGASRFTQKYSAGPPETKPIPGKDTYTFAETNHTVQGAFLDYWKQHGDVRRFGFPVSESFEEISDADGQPYLVQYFERAVLEYHPELPQPQRVQLSAVGSARHTVLYPSGAPASASLPQPSPTVNGTATAIAIANATSTAVTAERNAQSTAQAEAAHATSTAQTKASYAQATAEAKKYESYKTTAPTGDFSASGNNVYISCKLEYRQCISSWCANSTSKFVLVGVAVQNIGSDTVHVNPLNFTLVSTRGATVAHDSNTYLLDNYLDAVDIRPSTYTNGWIAFLVTKDFIPGELVWDEFLGETVEVTIVPREY